MILNNKFLGNKNNRLIKNNNRFNNKNNWKKDFKRLLFLIWSLSWRFFVKGLWTLTILKLMGLILLKVSNLKDGRNFSIALNGQFTLSWWNIFRSTLLLQNSKLLHMFGAQDQHLWDVHRKTSQSWWIWKKVLWYSN